MWSDTIVLNYVLETALYSLPRKCRIALFKTCVTFFNPPLVLSSEPFCSSIVGVDVDYRTFETQR